MRMRLSLVIFAMSSLVVWTGCGEVSDAGEDLIDAADTQDSIVPKAAPDPLLGWEDMPGEQPDLPPSVHEGPSGDERHEEDSGTAAPADDRDRILGWEDMPGEAPQVPPTSSALAAEGDRHEEDLEASAPGDDRDRVLGWEDMPIEQETPPRL